MSRTLKDKKHTTAQMNVGVGKEERGGEGGGEGGGRAPAQAPAKNVCRYVSGLSDREVTKTEALSRAQENTAGVSEYKGPRILIPK